MQHGSIGWSIGATFGYAQSIPKNRVIACIGDGSFQDETKIMLKNLKCILAKALKMSSVKGDCTRYFNNDPMCAKEHYFLDQHRWIYHDGRYNVIKTWNYTGLADAICNGEGQCWTTKVCCEEELIEAIETATSEKKVRLCFYSSNRSQR